MSEDMEKKRREDHEFWFCINGHQQHYVGKSELEKTKELLETQRKWTLEAQSRADNLNKQLVAQKGVTTRIKNRVGKGVCPCCNRSFTNLRRHMAGKHPEYKNE